MMEQTKQTDGVTQNRLRRSQKLLDEQDRPAATLPSPALPKAPVTPVLSEAKKDKGEVGGVDGPDPTRYGDWERNGRCIDF